MNTIAPKTHYHAELLLEGGHEREAHIWNNGRYESRHLALEAFQREVENANASELGYRAGQHAYLLLYPTRRGVREKFMPIACREVVLS